MVGKPKKQETSNRDRNGDFWGKTPSKTRRAWWSSRPHCPMPKPSLHPGLQRPVLVGGLVAMWIIFPYIGNNHPNWLSYFSEGFKPPTSVQICPAEACRVEDPAVSREPRQKAQPCWAETPTGSGKGRDTMWSVCDTCLITTWTLTWPSGVRSIEHYRKRLARILEAFQPRVSKILHDTTWYYMILRYFMIFHYVSRIVLTASFVLTWHFQELTWKACTRPQPIAAWHHPWYTKVNALPSPGISTATPHKVSQLSNRWPTCSRFCLATDVEANVPGGLDGFGRSQLIKWPSHGKNPRNGHLVIYIYKYILCTSMCYQTENCRLPCSFWQVKLSLLASDGARGHSLGPDPGPETAEAFPRCAWCGDASKTVCGRCKVRAYCAPPFAKDATADGQEHPVSDDYRI